ncbi:MAG: DUF4445 domain-containing protein [Eubacteriaceae bacterium]|nr:DUF4445 domain-containing protein [Eubacteriaceae bacterium]
MYKVVFKQTGMNDVVIDANPGEILLDLAKKANVPIDAPCSGNVSCGKCKIRVAEGTVESAITRHLSKSEWEEGYRLACNSKICADCVIDVPDIASAYQSRMKIADLSSYQEVKLFNDIQKGIEQAGIVFTTDMKLIQVKLDEPTMDDTMPDNERLERALKELTGIKRVYIPFEILIKLPVFMREHGFEFKCVTQTYQNLLTVLDIVETTEEKIYGFAVDIGTTSVTGLIVDVLTGKIQAKASTGNGQIRYGADVINRIIQQGKPGGIDHLRDAVCDETITPMLQNMCQSIDIEPGQIYRMCVASNTTMNHLFLGIPAENVRLEPFVPTYFEYKTLFGRSIDVPINPNAKVIIAPNIGSYVGGDITAGTLASLIWTKPEYSIFIDLGTNGEIVFGNSDFFMSCACSAGPAFEGGDISCGMRASDGAIEKVHIDKDTMEPTYSVIGDTKPVGICGSGIIDIIAELFRTGIINGKGKFIREGKRVVHDEHGTGSYVVAFREEAGSVKDVLLSEVDIDNFIRAKGAIFSAIRCMLSLLQLEVDVIENVYVAGGIGSGINMENAIMIGMLPDVPLEKYKYIGNSSLIGSFCMLTSTQAYNKVFEMARNMTYVELSNQPSYMDDFVGACFLPHTQETLFPSVMEKLNS